jgi:hypothetical protein
VIPESVLREIVVRIHAFPDLAGCPIGYQGGLQSRVLHPGFCESPLSERVVVLIEEVEVIDPAVLAELQRFAAGQGISPDGAPNPTLVTNDSVLGPELIGAGLSCGLTVVAALGVAGGVAAEVPTGGMSTFLVVAAWVGLTTSAIQCANGIVRVGAIIAAPDDNTLQRWDQNATYTNSILVVDALGVVSGLASLPFAARNLFAVLARQRSFLARGLSSESLRSMNRVQRLAVIRELFDEASRTPEGRAALVAAARQAGVGAQTMQRGASLSVRGATTLSRVIRDETVRRLSASLRDVIGGLVGPVGSGVRSSLVGSASGSVNYVINLIDRSTSPGSQGT